LWFSEQYGERVARYDPASDEWSAVELPCECWPLAFHDDGSLWLGSNGGLWFMAADGGLTRWTMEEGLPSDNVYSLAFAPDGHVLAGTTAGVAHLEDGEVTAIFNAENSGLASDNIRSLLAAPDGTVWVGTDLGLSRLLADGGWEHYTIGEPFDDWFDQTHSLGMSADGALWVGSGNDGAWRLLDGEWEHFDADNFLTGAAPDAEGGIWFGSYYSGAHYFNDGDQETFSLDDGLIHENVTDVYVDAEGVVWFATSSGVTRYVP
jgi:ligand-binding sensor domain-containing protein